MRRLAGWVLAVGLVACALRLPSAARPSTEENGRAGEGEGESHGGMLMLWKWANFALLATGLGYVIAKNAGPFFTKRTLEIRKGMIEAEELRADADARVATVEAKLANVTVEIEILRKEAQEEGAAERERIRQETAAELEKIRTHAKQEIASLGKAATMELKRYCAQLAIALAEQKIRSRITPEADAALVGKFINDMAHSTSGVQST
jgi:F-type H+-transporting ATPase subunit b